jgi:Family of unknown function (DUF5924)/Protein of unknown function (DUF2914)
VPSESAAVAVTREQRRAARKRWLEVWFARLSPWVSLVMSSVGAALMDRSEEQGAWVVGFAALGFLALILFGLAHRPRATASAPELGRLHKLVRFTTLASSQSLIQNSLFFSAPFYLQASAFTPGQCIFLAVFGAAVLICSWDPWCALVLRHPLLGPGLMAFASFAACNAVLPMLGVPHRRAIWPTALAVSVLLSAAHWFGSAPGLRRLEAVLAGLLLPLVLAALAVKLLPAAPLKVVEIGIGTGVEERQLVGRTTRFASAPERLTCLSAVFAPRGLSESLIHVWSRDGEPLSRIELSVRGGRKAGFRTWSTQPVARGARGVYRCELLTQLGQTLGVTQATIGKR